MESEPESDGELGEVGDGPISPKSVLASLPEILEGKKSSLKDGSSQDSKKINKRLLSVLKNQIKVTEEFSGAMKEKLLKKDQRLSEIEKDRVKKAKRIADMEQEMRTTRKHVDTLIKKRSEDKHKYRSRRLEEQGVSSSAALFFIMSILGLNFIVLGIYNPNFSNVFNLDAMPGVKFARDFVGAHSTERSQIDLLYKQMDVARQESSECQAQLAAGASMEPRFEMCKEEKNQAIYKLQDLRKEQKIKLEDARAACRRNLDSRTYDWEHEKEQVMAESQDDIKGFRRQLSDSRKSLSEADKKISNLNADNHELLKDKNYIQKQLTESREACNKKAAEDQLKIEEDRQVKKELRDHIETQQVFRGEAERCRKELATSNLATESAEANLIVAENNSTTCQRERNSALKERGDCLSTLEVEQQGLQAAKSQLDEGSTERVELRKQVDVLKLQATSTEDAASLKAVVEDLLNFDTGAIRSLSNRVRVCQDENQRLDALLEQLDRSSIMNGTQLQACQSRSTMYQQDYQTCDQNLQTCLDSSSTQHQNLNEAIARQGAQETKIRDFEASTSAYEARLQALSDKSTKEISSYESKLQILQEQAKLQAAVGETLHESVRKSLLAEQEACKQDLVVVQKAQNELQAAYVACGNATEQVKEELHKQINHSEACASNLTSCAEEHAKSVNTVTETCQQEIALLRQSVEAFEQSGNSTIENSVAVEAGALNAVLAHLKDTEMREASCLETLETSNEKLEASVEKLETSALTDDKSQTALQAKIDELQETRTALRESKEETEQLQNANAALSDSKEELEKLQEEETEKLQQANTALLEQQKLELELQKTSSDSDELAKIHLEQQNIDIEQQKTLVEDLNIEKEELVRQAARMQLEYTQLESQLASRIEEGLDSANPDANACVSPEVDGPSASDTSQLEMQISLTSEKQMLVAFMDGMQGVKDELFALQGAVASAAAVTPPSLPSLEPSTQVSLEEMEIFLQRLDSLATRVNDTEAIIDLVLAQETTRIEGLPAPPPPPPFDVSPPDPPMFEELNTTLNLSPLDDQADVVVFWKSFSLRQWPPLKRASVLLALVLLDLVLFQVFLPRNSRLCIFLVVVMWVALSYQCVVAQQWVLAILFSSNCVLGTAFFFKPSLAMRLSIHKGFITLS